MTFSLEKPLSLWYYTHTTPNLKSVLTHLVLWDILLNSDKTLAPWNDDLHFSLKHIKYLLYQCSVNIFDICQTNNVHVSSSKIFQLIVNAQSFWEVLPHIIRYQLSIYDMRYLRYLLKHFLAFPSIAIRYLSKCHSVQYLRPIADTGICYCEYYWDIFLISSDIWGWSLTRDGSL